MPDVSVDLVVNTMEDGKKPAVASIDGLALGGGLELALGCPARIAAPQAQLGLPELSLGVIPGFGGTQHLLRLIGLSKAAELMMTSKPIMSEEGKKLGLIDAIVPSSELLKVSRQWTLDIAERRKPWMRSLYKTDKIGSLSEAREVLKVAREQVKQTAKKMPQHLACIGVIEEGIIHGGYNGVLKEAKVFKDLVLTDKKVAVIGGGLMGSGIATALALSNTIVILKEINSEYLQKGIKAIEANIIGLVARKKWPQEKADKALSMVKGALDYSDFKDVDMVIEAVIENVPLKQKIFSEIEKIVRTEKTSAQAILDLMAVGKAIKKVPVVVGNCTGLMRKLPALVSLWVPSSKNNGKGYYIYEKGRKPRPDFTVLPIIEESRRLTNIMPGGKPIFVTDQEIVEMILFPVVNEACRVLDEGIVVRASDLDVASVLVMSFPSYRGGIVFWADTVGAGRINRSLKKWSELYGNFFKPSRFLEERAMKDVPFSASASTSSASRSR
ncbi:Peroxisomal fatty acid beta-oxidation multifunctional protein AIM1, partial [Capsicum annuum]